MCVCARVCVWLSCVLCVCVSGIGRGVSLGSGNLQFSEHNTKSKVQYSRSYRYMVTAATYFKLPVNLLC